MKTLALAETTTNPDQNPEASTEAHTTAPAETSVLGSLGINASLFAFQLINFAIIAAIIWFLILKPITKKMTERAKIIDEGLENAKKMEENLRRSEIKFQERVDEAKVEANKIVERATADALVSVNGMKAKAQTEVEALVEKAKEHISLERVRMLEELKIQSVEVIVLALEKLLKEKVTDVKDQAIIQDLVKKLR